MEIWFCYSLYLNFTPRQFGAWISRMPNLQWQKWNRVFSKGLVNIFATWRLEGMKMACTASNWILSLTKWQFNSMSFVYSWKTRFVSMCIAAWLSQYIFTTPKSVTCKSWPSELISNGNHDCILYFYQGTRHIGLLLGFLRNEWLSKKNKISYDIFSCGRTTSPICVIKSNKFQIILG